MKLVPTPKFTAQLGISFDDVLVDGSIYLEFSPARSKAQLLFTFDRGQVFVLDFPSPEKLNAFCTAHNFPIIDHR